MKDHQPTYALLPSMAEESFVGAFFMKVYIANISGLDNFLKINTSILVRAHWLEERKSEISYNNTTKWKKIHLR